jgi:hypothetical protein
LYHQKFSICTIVSNPDEYSKMLDSFKNQGFDNDCEYIVADNSSFNQYDAYTAINWFLQVSTGRYILIIHQDVRCIDAKKRLEEIVEQLEAKDPLWAVAGNAGCNGYKNCFFYLKDPGNKKLDTGLPKKVTSLDENFLLVNKKQNVTVSSSLSGFHLYGTDICINAIANGHTCYVIPFLVEHLSLGNLQSLKDYIPVFLQEYQPRLSNVFIQTTCTKFYLGTSQKQTNKLNKGIWFEIIKFYQRIKLLVSKPS